MTLYTYVTPYDIIYFEKHRLAFMQVNYIVYAKLNCLIFNNEQYYETPWKNNYIFIVLHFIIFNK